MQLRILPETALFSVLFCQHSLNSISKAISQITKPTPGMFVPIRMNFPMIPNMVMKFNNVDIFWAIVPVLTCRLLTPAAWWMLSSWGYYRKQPCSVFSFEKYLVLLKNVITITVEVKQFCQFRWYLIIDYVFFCTIRLIGFVWVV